MKTKSLSDQIAIITGGGTGIGRAFARALAMQGTTVAIASRQEDVLRRTADEINSECGIERVFPYRCDVRSRAEVEELVGHITDRWNTVDILINNSGLAIPEDADSITDQAWDKVMETNLRGPMYLVGAVLPHMLKNDFGDIVNISSQAGKHGYSDVPSYCASKFGLLGYAEAVRDHVRKLGKNVRVFNLCPGLVDVENTETTQKPRPGFIHVVNLARTLLYALSLDRDVMLEDINIYAR